MDFITEISDNNGQGMHAPPSPIHLKQDKKTNNVMALRPAAAAGPNLAPTARTAANSSSSATELAEKPVS